MLAGDTSLPVLNFEDIDMEEPESSVVTGDEALVKPEDSEAILPVDVERNEVSSVSMEMDNDANKENMPQVEETTSEYIEKLLIATWSCHHYVCVIFLQQMENIIP